jgi:hypothetical protein
MDCGVGVSRQCQVTVGVLGLRQVGGGDRGWLGVVQGSSWVQAGGGGALLYGVNVGTRK